MTAYLEEFGSNPSWSNVAATYGHDATNGELYVATASGGANYFFRSDDAPGGMEHECQGTFITHNANGAGWQGPLAVRGTSAADNQYSLQFEPGAGTNGTLYLVRTVAGIQATAQSWSIDIDTSNFWTARLAAEGGNGANVSLSVWYTNHGASKPSLQDWIGVDGSPDQTYTDTAANRLDDSATNLYCGAAGYEDSSARDLRLDYHRIRLVSDRGAGTTDAAIDVNTTGTVTMAGASAASAAVDINGVASASWVGASAAGAEADLNINAAGAVNWVGESAAIVEAEFNIGASASLTMEGAARADAAFGGLTAPTFVAQVGPEPVDDDHARLTTLPDGFGDVEFTLHLWFKADDSYPFGTVSGGGSDIFNNWATEDPAPPSYPDYSAWWIDNNWLIDGQNNNGAHQGSFSLSFYGSGRLRWICGDGVTQFAPQAYPATDATNLVDNQWHMATCVRRFSGASDSDYELWVDGTLIDSITRPNRINHATSYWDSWTGFPSGEEGWFFGAEKLAALNTGTHQADFKGLVSTVAFFSDARTSGEIAADYALGVGGLTGSEGNLVGLYRMDEGTGTTSSDELASGGNITYYLGTSVTAPTWDSENAISDLSWVGSSAATADGAFDVNTSATVTMEGASSIESDISISGVGSITMEGATTSEAAADININAIATVTMEGSSVAESDMQIAPGGQLDWIGQLAAEAAVDINSTSDVQMVGEAVSEGQGAFGISASANMEMVGASEVSGDVSISGSGDITMEGASGIGGGFTITSGGELIFSTEEAAEEEEEVATGAGGGGWPTRDFYRKKQRIKEKEEEEFIKLIALAMPQIIRHITH